MAEQKKTIHVVNSKPRFDKLIEITPTDTATDVLTRIDLNPNEYFIIKPGDQTEFGMDEAVYPLVADGGKLNVVPQSNVGGDYPRPFFYKLPGSSPRLSSYAEDLGWTPIITGTLTGTTYHGYYRINNGLRWKGEVHQTPWGDLQFKIKNPPITYLRQSEWAGCFHALDNDWMWITFKKHPPDIDSGITAVNKILKHIYEHRPPVMRRMSW